MHPLPAAMWSRGVLLTVAPSRGCSVSTEQGEGRAGRHKNKEGRVPELRFKS